MPDASFDHQAFLQTLTARPGVYRMLGEGERVLYVGKAKNLKRRVGSYFTRSLNRRIQVMVSQIQRIEVVVTHTEAEALILENNLIKSLKPRYNVLLRDDKSYPYIHLSSDQEFPALSFRRGSRRGRGRYFGPYPSAGTTRDTLQLLQQLALGVELLDDRLDHEPGIGGVAEIVDWGDALEGLGGVDAIELAFIAQLVKGIRQTIARIGSRARFQVV